MFGDPLDTRLAAAADSGDELAHRIEESDAYADYPVFTHAVEAWGQQARSLLVFEVPDGFVRFEHALDGGDPQAPPETNEEARAAAVCLLRSQARVLRELAKEM